MTDKPQSGAPPENEVANVQASEIDIPRLIEIAQAIMPRGALRHYLKNEPSWCRRAGDDAFMRLCVCRLPDPSEIDLLLRAYDRAVARRDQQRLLDAKNREVVALARRIRDGERVPAGALSAILGPVK